jgi:hypothetical protein
MVFWSKAAKAFATTPSKGVTLPGRSCWSKAAKALSTNAVKRRDFAGLFLLVESGQGPFDKRRQKL